MHLVDLSHPLEHGQPVFPGDPEIRVIPHSEAGYNITKLGLSSHHGTHLDAPFHFFANGLAVDCIPLERFYGPAVLIDFGALEPGTVIPVEMLEPHSALFHDGARVIYRTGWDRRFGSAGFFAGYPSLTAEAARWIAAKNIALLGMDTPGPGEEDVHRALLGAEIVVVESLANLGKLPADFTFIGFPLKIKGRDGSPIRAVAVVEN